MSGSATCEVIDMDVETWPDDDGCWHCLVDDTAEAAVEALRVITGMVVAAESSSVFSAELIASMVDVVEVGAAGGRREFKERQR